MLSYIYTLLTAYVTMAQETMINTKLAYNRFLKIVLK